SVIAFKNIASNAMSFSFLYELVTFYFNIHSENVLYAGSSFGIIRSQNKFQVILLETLSDERCLAKW
ncbi:hypothetical protein ACYYIN_003150, partial [Listeria monocytogenes]